MGGSPRVLVAYATAAGSTADLAERIAAVLGAAGCATTCAPVQADPDPGDADAVVVGSAVHDMAWLAPAVAFLGRVAASGRPVWCFSVGGLARPYAGAVSRRLAGSELRRVEQGFPAGLAPRDHRLFAGAVSTTGGPLWARVFWRLTGSGPGDHRDWPAVEGWARGVAAAVRADAGSPTGSQGPGSRDLGHSPAAGGPPDARR